MGAPSTRPLRLDDRDAVLDLKCRVFEGCRLEAERQRWRWQFETNPAAAAGIPIGVVVEVDGVLAGSFAYVPLRIQIGGRVGLALDGIDLCVDPRHQGRGLGRLLNEELWRPSFCDFPFATGVNAASHRLFSEGGAALLGGTTEQTGFAYFIHDRHADAPTAALAVHEMTAFEESADRLWAALRDEWRLGLVRDAAYLNWRYRDFPFQPAVLLTAGPPGEPRGIAVLQEDPVQRRWYLLELLTAKADREARAALLTAVRDRVAASPHEAVYYATRQDDQRGCLAAADFQPVPGEYPTFMGKLHEESDAVSVSDWTVSLGDGDQLYGVGAGAGP